MKVTNILAFGLLCCLARLTAVGQSPAFEVASIKPIVSPPGVFGIRMKLSAPSAPLIPTGGEYRAKVNLRDLMMDAYAIYDYQVIGLPSWAIPGPGGDRYEIVGKPEGTTIPTSDQLRLMLQTLLADRFHLQFHRETRELPIYELTIDKNGPKMRLATDKTPKDVPKGTVGALIQHLLIWLDRPVVDKTGLTGTYEIGLPLNEFVGQGRPAPSIFSVVPQELGLKLTATKGPVEVLVVDHAEKPIPN